MGISDVFIMMTELANLVPLPHLSSIKKQLEGPQERPPFEELLTTVVVLGGLTSHGESCHAPGEMMTPCGSECNLASGVGRETQREPESKP